MSSQFITFEGPDGAGKSTQIRLLRDYLQGQGCQVCTTREPGGTPIGDQIRQVLHDVNNTAMVPVAEILLYSASRAQLVAQVIKPLLAVGTIVLCDRYADSTYAYQGYGRGLDLAMLKMVTEFATQKLQPDLTLYLDLPVEVSLARKQRASETGESELNRMDQLTLDFYERVRQGYLAMARANPERWSIIDAGQSAPVIHQAIAVSFESICFAKVARMEFDRPVTFDKVPVGGEFIEGFTTCNEVTTRVIVNLRNGKGNARRSGGKYVWMADREPVFVRPGCVGCDHLNISVDPPHYYCLHPHWSTKKRGSIGTGSLWLSVDEPPVGYGKFCPLVKINRRRK